MRRRSKALPCALVAALLAAAAPAFASGPPDRGYAPSPAASSGAPSGDPSARVAVKRGYPLLSRFARDVSRSRPRPEYPRPQWRRTRWRSLNGRWSVALGRQRPRPVLVPFPYQAPLSGIGRTGIHERVSYRKLFRVPAAWRRGGRRILLHFGAVDWEATVRVNDRRVAVHRGGYTPFTADVTGALRPGERQRLTVDVLDPVGPEATQPLGKQLARQRIYYTRTTGIWQSVWIEPVERHHLRVDEARIEGQLDRGRVRLEAGVRGRADELRIAVRRRGRPVAERRARLRGERRLVKTVRVPAPEPWSPENPALYTVTIRLLRDGRVVDRVHSYVGFRTVRVRDGRVELNGRPYQLKGVLDQGFWPDGLYAAPTDEALRHDVVMAKRYGFNLARKHVKVEDPRWYWWCDRLGLLVAQDMPSSRNLSTSGARSQFTAEWEEMIGTLTSHPSVAMWIAFNENWGRPSAAFQAATVRRARDLDPTRLVVDGSGSPRRGFGDLVDFHDYNDDLARYSRPDPPSARWIGEYGGITLRVPGHIWHEDTDRAPARTRTREQMLERYRFLTDQVNGAPGLSGFVYTQLSDVEHELNGLMTYDRFSKVPTGRIAAVNAGPS